MGVLDGVQVLERWGQGSNDLFAALVSWHQDISQLVDFRAIKIPPLEELGMSVLNRLKAGESASSGPTACRGKFLAYLGGDVARLGGLISASAPPESRIVANQGARR